MDDIEKLFRARKNVLDMMKDRGYNISPELHISTKEELKRKPDRSSKKEIKEKVEVKKKDTTKVNKVEAPKVEVPKD